MKSKVKFAAVVALAELVIVPIAMSGKNNGHPHLAFPGHFPMMALLT